MLLLSIGLGLRTNPLRSLLGGTVAEPTGFSIAQTFTAKRTTNTTKTTTTKVLFPIILNTTNSQIYSQVKPFTPYISPNNKTLYDVVTQLTTQINIKIFDEITSTFKGLRFNNGSPRIISQPYTYEIAEGHIPGHDKFVKIGYNGALGSSFEDLWPVGGTYVFPDAAQQMELVSSSAQDGVDGTGVRSVRLTYLTDDFTVKTEDITLNGVTPVLTVATDIYRVQNMRSLTTGTGYVAAGNIDIRNLAETPIYGRIATGYNRLRQCIYTVPKGKTLYITNVLVGCGATTAGRAVTFNTMATYDDISNSLIPFFQVLSEILLQDASISLTLDVPTKLIAGTNFKVRAISPVNLTYASCIIRGWIE